MPRLQAANLKSLNTAPLGPGVILANVVDMTPLGIAAIIAGDESKGIKLGALTDAPTFNAAPEFQDLTENIVGLNAAFRGAQQLQRVDVTIECEIAELHQRNLRYVHPGLAREDWSSASHATKKFGTDPASFNLTARATGTGGNSISLTLVAASGSNEATSVAVVGDAITVTLGTGGVAGTPDATVEEVVDAINAHAVASEKVQAGYNAKTNPSAVVAAAASSSLAGGAAGSRIGTRLVPQGFVSDSDYLDNLVLALEGVNTPVLQLYRIFSAISNDDVEYQPDDEGNISSIAATFMGHAADASYDPETGVYLPPYDIFTLDPPSVV